MSYLYVYIDPHMMSMMSNLMISRAGDPDRAFLAGVGGGVVESHGGAQTPPHCSISPWQGGTKCLSFPTLCLQVWEPNELREPQPWGKEGPAQSY